VYGFKDFAHSFLDEFPEHFTCPLQPSGSAVETLFSQFKHTSGGKLSSTNYSTARATHLILWHLSQCALEKKKYEQKQ